MIYGKIDEKLIEIYFLATRVEFQRSGGAEELLETFKGFEIWLELKKKNFKALRFYEKQGFLTTGERKSYYSDGGSALNMVRK